MTQEKSPIELVASANILIHPDGTKDGKVLEKILEDATDWERDTGKKLNSSTRISITHEKRVSDFNPNDPRWEQVKESYPLKTVRRWYKEETGRSFKYRRYKFDEFSGRRVYLE